MSKKKNDELDLSGDAPGMFTDQTTLADLTKRCEYLDKLWERHESLEEEIDAIKKEIDQIAMQELPELFQSIGLSELKLENGRKLTLLPFYSAKIPDATKSEAFKWLEEHEHDGIIKSTVEMTFGKGDEEKKQEARVVKALEKLGVLFEHDRKIHPQTLKAFVREMVESGEEFPLETFGAFVGKVVKIK